MGKLEGKAALVTGAGRGLGRAIAKGLAAQGAAVVVNDFGVTLAGEKEPSSPADQMVAEIKAAGGKAVANHGSVAKWSEAEAMVRQAIREFGKLDILVNVAGILRDRMIFNMSEEEWDAVIAVHLKGHFTVTKAASIIFRQQRSGRIVNTGSSSGLGNMGQANYSAAKEGIVGLTRTLARDLGRYGVTCNAIRPGAATRMTLSPEMAEAARRAEAAGIRRGGTGTLADLKPEAIAPLVVYLCTDAAQNVNGRDFAVSGRQIGLYTIPTVEKAIYAPGEMWTLDELEQIFPRTIGAGLRNEFGPREPAPAPAS